MLTDYEQIRSMKKWKDGVISSTSGGNSAFLILFGGVFLGIGIFAAIKEPQALTLELNKDKFVFLFPAVGLLILTFGLIKLLRTVKFRNARFIISDVPTAMGTTLKGKLILPANKIPNNAKIKLSLINEREYKSTSINRRDNNVNRNRKQTQILSKEDINIDSSSFTKDHQFDDSIACNISIPITNDGKDSSRNSGNNKYRWYLKVYSRIPGANLDLDFTLPIYRTQKTS